MKKILLALAVICNCMMAKAWNVGDYYDADGVPSVIVYVDETGEHGLRMGPRFFWTAEIFKEALKIEEERNPKSYQSDSQTTQKLNDAISAREKAIAEMPEGPKKEKALRQLQIAKSVMQGTNKREQRDSLLAMLDTSSIEEAERIKQELIALDDDPYMVYKNALDFVERQEYRFIDYSERKLKVMKNNFEELAKINTGSGEENTTNIFEYCQKNGINVDLYFPEYVYAKSLGDNWFIPGNDELELVAKAFLDGVGKEFKISAIRETPHLKYKYTNWHNAKFFFPYLDLRSSTLVKSKWADNGNKSKVEKLANSTVRHDYYSLLLINEPFAAFHNWYVFTSNYESTICAPFCKF